MTIEVTPAQARQIYLWADRELQYLRDPVIWLKSREEWEMAVARCEGILAQCETAIRAAGEWEEHVRKVEWIRRHR